MCVLGIDWLHNMGISSYAAKVICNAESARRDVLFVLKENMLQLIFITCTDVVTVFAKSPM